MTTMVARYFNKTLVLDTALNVPDGTTVEIQVKDTETNEPEVKPQRVPGRFRGQVWIADDFNEPLPDEFWLGGNP